MESARMLRSDWLLFQARVSRAAAPFRPEIQHFCPVFPDHILTEGRSTPQLHDSHTPQAFWQLFGVVRQNAAILVAAF